MPGNCIVPSDNETWIARKPLKAPIFDHPSQTIMHLLKPLTRFGHQHTPIYNLGLSEDPLEPQMEIV
jgi:hypothetical protein